MFGAFSKNIAGSVSAEIRLSKEREKDGLISHSFRHLENAHVLGQESTKWHVKVHFLMLLWAIRQRNTKECLGQVLRIIGAFSKTAIGLIPHGNTGGSNISPFKTLPIKAEHQILINNAKRNET